MTVVVNAQNLVGTGIKRCPHFRGGIQAPPGHHVGTTWGSLSSHLETLEKWGRHINSKYEIWAF